MNDRSREETQRLKRLAERQRKYRARRAARRRANLARMAFRCFGVAVAVGFFVLVLSSETWSFAIAMAVIMAVPFIIGTYFWRKI